MGYTFGEERELRPGEEILHHYPALAESLVKKHAGQRGARFLKVLSDDDSLACGQAVILQHGRERPSGHVLQRLVVGREAAVPGRGDAILEHQLLGKFL